MNLWSISKKIALAIPILPVGSKDPQSIRASRRSPGAIFVSPSDITQNISDKYFAIVNKTPVDAQYIRDRDGSYQASVYKTK